MGTWNKMEHLMEIKGFKGEYRWLSNFFPALITLDGVEYSSVENAYQAAKFYPELRKKFRFASPHAAKKLGKNKFGRIQDVEWNSIKLKVMYDLSWQKYTNHRDLKQRLLETGDAYIEETNTWGDTFWGVCNDKGKNHLGKILMNIRSKL
jgi:ribA/ribD-fused uncharacterized protein